MYLGNLKTQEMLDRLGIEVTKEEFETLDSKRCDLASIEPGKWHCFDIPFVFACYDNQVAEELAVGILKKYASKMKTKIEVAIKYEW